MDQTQLDTVVDTPLEGGCNTNNPPYSRGRCWFMTWNSYPEDWKTQLTQKTQEWKGQLEEGAGGTRHIQACFRYTNPRTFEQVRAAFPGAHIEPCKDWRKSVAYCTKEKTRVPTDERPDYFRLNNCIAHRWQQTIIDIITGEVDDRKIYWFWSEHGGYGKTTFARHLIIRHNAYLITGCSRDAFHAVSEAKPSCVIFDIARDDTIDYKTLECIKNGLFFSGKYESAMYCGVIPHVIVLANKPPIKEKLSADRWEIFEITPAIVELPL